MLSHFDENILEKYVGEEEITVDDLRARASAPAPSPARSSRSSTAPRSRTRACSPCSTPSSTTSRARSTCRRSRASNIKGNEELERKAADDEPFAALAFKIMTDPHVGKLTYFRVYSRHAREGRHGRQHHQRQQGAHRPHPADARQPPRGRRRRLHRRHRRRHRPQEHHAPATRSATPAHAIVLENLEFPEPVIHVAVEPKTKVDQDKMGKALFALSEEDPTFQVRTDEETGQTVISGMGELHLEVHRRPHAARVQGRRHRRQAAGRLPRDHHPDGRASTPTRHKKQTGGSGQYAEVIIDLEPTGPGGGYEFVDKITGGRIPKEYIPSVDAGIQQSLDAGVLAGYPTVDVRAILTDG